MNSIIIYFLVNLVLGSLFLVRFKRKTITEKDFKKTAHKGVII